MSDVEVPPRRWVLDGFGAPPVDVAPLTGGISTAWRAGPLVLKRLDMSVAALEWQAGVLADLDDADDVRVAPPARSRDGRLVLDGWAAWRYEPGEPPTRSQWPEVMAAGRALHRHLTGVPRPGFLDRRDDPWSRADRIAWGEDTLADGRDLPHVAALLEARRPVTLPAQLIHGDLTDNVHLHPRLPPLVLDLSPCWRPVAFATAVVVADAVVFRGAELGVVRRTCAEEGADFPQLLVRALLFRAVGDHLLAPEKDEEWPRWFAPAVGAVLPLARR